MDKYILKRLEEADDETWDKFVDESPQGTIFNKSWYLKYQYKNYYINTVLDAGNKIIAGMVLGFHQKTNHIIFNKSLYDGILFCDMSELKENKKNTMEIELSTILIESIPKVGFYYSTFHYTFDNWVPFLWKGYDQYTKYSYVIDNSREIDTVFDAFSGSARRYIKQAAKSIRNISYEASVENYQSEFYKQLEEVYKHQNKNTPMSFNEFCMYDNMLKENNARKVFFAYLDDKIISAVYVIYDNKSAYLVMSGNDNEYRSYNAQYLLTWEAIKYFNNAKIKYFDFEGSVMKNVEEHYRKYGGTYKPYYVITKSNNILFDFIWYLRKRNRTKRLYAEE